jgi:hypothetical protein
MSRRHLAKKISLKLKKGGEGKSKRSTKQTPNRPSRKVLKPSSPSKYPIENKDFELGDIYKPATEQTVVGIRNGKIVPIDKISYQSDSPNTEIAIAPALREGIKSKTEKMKKAARIKSLKFTRKARPSSSSRSSEGSFETEQKTGFALKKLKKLIHKSRSPSSRSSELSIETGFTRH